MNTHAHIDTHMLALTHMHAHTHIRSDSRTNSHKHGHKQAGAVGLISSLLECDEEHFLKKV